jgi:hypothetical protein
LRNGGRREGIGRYDIGAGMEIGEMNIADRLRAAEIEQIVVAAHVAIPRIEPRSAIAFLVEP